MQMAVRGASTLTPFSIQAILNKKEQRAGLPAPDGRSLSGGTAVCCWRLFGETDSGALGTPEDSLLESPARIRTAAGRSADSPGDWDSDSALSEDHEGGRHCAHPPGPGAAGGTLGHLGQPVCQLPAAAKELEEGAAGRSDSEMSVSVSGSDAQAVGWQGPGAGGGAHSLTPPVALRPKRTSGRTP